MKKCNHRYFINEDNQSECKNCGLLESTIKECYTEEYKSNIANKTLEEKLNDIIVKYSNKDGMFDLVDGFIPLKKFIIKELQNQKKI